MLVPVRLVANYKVSTSEQVVLEDLLGSNLPLLFPDVTVINRTPTNCSLSVAGIRRFTFLTQTDSDFDGVLNATLFTTFSLGIGLSQKLSGLDQSGLLPSSYGVIHQLTLSNAGPAAAAWVTLVVKGLVESSIQPDPLVVVNV